MKTMLSGGWFEMGEGSMMARRTFGRGVLGLLLGGATFALGGCGSSSADYRFRMTVEAKTPEGVQSGSSVMEVSASRGMTLGDRTGVNTQLRGEAVVVDLPDGPVFVLLKLPDAGFPLLSVAGDALRGHRSPSPDDVVPDTAKLGSTWFSEYKADLPKEDWPMMVRFRDINDPKTVERVDPDAVGIKRIHLETTSDDVTTGIEGRLGWLASQRGALIKRAPGDFPVNPPLAYLLNESDFSSELINVK